MCGIAGIILGRGDGRVDRGVLRQMTRALSARGPDGEGFFIEEPVGFGHRRLAVIDVEGGAQPLFTEDRRIVAVVNGEFYNFMSLRRKLEGRGHRFSTSSDSEVLVHGFEEWGEAVLDQLEGMFAFALWSRDEGRLVLARDRFGEKPLYYARLPGGGLAFASELRALRCCPEIDLSVDSAALARYLVYEYVPSPLTIIRGARKLEPATMLAMTTGREPQISVYWDLPLPEVSNGFARRPRRARPEAVRLLEELRRSVRERLVSDVPLGVFLSGGVDSSAVAALAAEVRGEELDTFSIGFEDQTFDETDQARAVAAALGTRHHEARLSSGFVLDVIPQMGELLDEPLGDGSFVPTLLLSRFAREHVTVALGGDGGDDLFAGYPTFQAERLAGWFVDRPPRPVSAAMVSGVRLLASALPVSQRYMAFDFKLKQLLKGLDVQGPRRHQAWLGSLSPKEALGALTADVAREAGEELYDSIDSRLERCPSRNPWDRLLYFYVKGYLGENILTKVDRASMSVALEVRTPFLDRGVVERACRCAPDLRLHGLTTKHVLKLALDGIVPDETIHRGKKGFGMPIGRWLQGELRPLLEEELGRDRLRREGLFEARAIRKMIGEHFRNEVDHRKPLWTLLAFQSWYRAWLSNPSEGAHLDG